jgi:Ser/Thr protein kinase RdoA (MazF antagonist)
MKAGAESRSHERKLKSYAVESNWYRAYAERCDHRCRVPKLLGQVEAHQSWLFVFEDLDESGFRERVSYPSPARVRAVLSWLAAFHATFLGAKAKGLWSIGTYWHFETRPDEYAALKDPQLRHYARSIDTKLNACRHKTLVHGDAKIENFCFSAEPDSRCELGDSVAAVDFQYVGAGCGMKDLAYFMSSIWSPAECAAFADDALAYYFAELRTELERRQSTIDPADVEVEWRALYPFAWADFQRFFQGWAPSYPDADVYAKQMVLRTLQSLENESSTQFR